MNDGDHNSAIESVFRYSYAVVLARLATRFRDIDLAEEAIQDALVEALRTWPVKGNPSWDRPIAPPGNPHQKNRSPGRPGERGAFRPFGSVG